MNSTDDIYIYTTGCQVFLPCEWKDLVTGITDEDRALVVPGLEQLGLEHHLGDTVARSSIDNLTDCAWLGCRRLTSWEQTRDVVREVDGGRVHQRLRLELLSPPQACVRAIFSRQGAVNTALAKTCLVCILVVHIGVCLSVLVVAVFLIRGREVGEDILADEITDICRKFWKPLGKGKTPYVLFTGLRVEDATTDGPGEPVAGNRDQPHLLRKKKGRV